MATFGWLNFEGNTFRLGRCVTVREAPPPAVREPAAGRGLAAAGGGWPLWAPPLATA